MFVNVDGERVECAPDASHMVTRLCPLEGIQLETPLGTIIFTLAKFGAGRAQISLYVPKRIPIKYVRELPSSA